MILWIVIVACILSWGLGWFACASIDFIDEMLVFVSIAFGVLSTAITLCLLIVIVVNHFTFPGYLVKAEAFRQEIERARSQDIESVEMAALQGEIIKFNTELAVNKHWQENKWTCVFYPKGIADVEPLR